MTSLDKRTIVCYDNSMKGGNMNYYHFYAEDDSGRVFECEIAATTDEEAYEKAAVKCRSLHNSIGGYNWAFQIKEVVRATV